jgi:hypothetical protein
MPRGGARPNSGPKSRWRDGRTKTIRVPEALAETLLALAREWDRVGIYEPVSGSIDSAADRAVVEQGGIDALRRRLRPLPAEEQDRLLAMQLDELQALRRELEAARMVAAEAPQPLNQRPWWLDIIKKQVLALPNRLGRLLVLRLLMNHQSYCQERHDELQRRPAGSATSEAGRIQREQGRQRLATRLKELDILLLSFPVEMLAEARALDPNWSSRIAVGARRSYDSLIAKMDR